MKTTGLTLAEAHTSGRNYKRKGKSLFWRPRPDIPIRLEDAIATDYELEPEAKLLTREDVAEALARAYCNFPTRQFDGSIGVRLCNILFGEESKG